MDSTVENIYSEEPCVQSPGVVATNATSSVTFRGLYPASL